MELVSRPHTVTVHRLGATVERRVTLDAPASGPVRLPGLPLSMLDDTVALAVEGGTAELRTVRIQLHAKPREESPLHPDHEALRMVRRQLAHARRLQEQRDLERQLFDAVPMPERPEPPEGTVPPPSPLAARVALDGFVDEMLKERQAELREGALAIDELCRQEAALLDVIRRAGLARQARPDELSKAVSAELQLHDAHQGPLTLVLRYRVPGARWVPQYALDVARDGSQARLVVRAALAQASGEDWDGVHLVLSTAEPLLPCPLPVLHALRIGKEQPLPDVPTPRPPPAGAERLFADYDRARRGLPVPRPQAPPAPPPEMPEPSPLEELLMDVDELEEPSPVMSLSHDDADGFGAAESVVMREEEPRLRAKRKAAPPPPSAPRMMSAPMPSGGPAAPKPAIQRAVAPPPPPRVPQFGQLRLLAPDDTRRGTLSVVKDAERQRELFAELGIELAFDPAQILAAARQRAADVAALGLPGGTQAVHPDRFDHAMRADAVVEVPGDGSWHTVPIHEATGDCSIRYVGAPRAEAALYRVARLPNPLGVPLLGGPVEVYVDGSYVLTTDLPVAGPGEAIELGMGVEPALRVARNSRFHEERSGDRVAMTELHHTVEIEVRNTLGRAVDVEVRERLPQPRKDAEVAVDEVTVSPPWEAWDQRSLGKPILGGRRWTLTIDASSSTTLSAHYVVRLYANHEVVGGNRREA